jgi:predicted Zn-ribbon and HTH transcriptional regulator
MGLADEVTGAPALLLERRAQSAGLAGEPMKRDEGPKERSATIRELLEAELREGPATARELSQAVGIPEKEVADHLEHLQKSIEALGEKLVLHPAGCVACGYAFADRTRFKKPSRCPKCGRERIDPPAFSIE